MSDRLSREKEFHDELVLEPHKTRSLLDRFSDGFYEKGSRGRLWGSFWETTNLKGAVVLDYGCGRGGFSQMLANLGASVYGIDISPHLIEYARTWTANAMNGSSRLPRFLVCDAEHTPFSDGTFDYVLGNGALHHLDLDGAYAEIARVLKPGGKAAFMEPMYHHPLLWSLRRLTPKAHTVDEKPLSLADIDKAKQWFRVCSHREHFLFFGLRRSCASFGERVCPCCYRHSGPVRSVGDESPAAVPPVRLADHVGHGKVARVAKVVFRKLFFLYGPQRSVAPDPECEFYMSYRLSLGRLGCGLSI